MDRVEVVKSQASQKLWFRAPEGRPTATPTVGIVDSGGTTITAAATTYVTQDTVNTTLSATAAALSRTMTLTAVTGIRVDATYRVKNALSQFEDVRVIAINASTKVVTLDEPTQYAYASADTFQSCEYYYTLQSGDVDELGEMFVATGTHSVTGSVTQPLIVPFDVVLHPLNNPLTVDRVKSRWPDIMSQEFDEQRGEDFSRQRADAWDRVKSALRKAGKRPACIVSVDDLFEWGMAELALVLQEGGVDVIRGLEPQQALEYLLAKRNNEKQMALNSLAYYDADEDAALEEEERKQPMIHMVR